MKLLTDTKLETPMSTPSYRGYGREARPRPRLSPRMWKLLTEGDVNGDYGHDPRRVAFAIVMEFARVEQHASDVLADWLERYPGGEWYRKLLASRGRQGAYHELETLYERSIAKLTAPISSREEVQVLAAQIRDAAALAVLPGRSAEAQRKLLIAHATISLSLGRLTYDVSVRDLAKLAGIHHNTVVRHHRKLIGELHLIERVAVGHGDKADRYRLSERTLHKLVTHILGDQVGPCVTTSGVPRVGDLMHPAFRHGGKLHAQTYYVLDEDDAQSTTQIAAKTGARAETARRRVTALASAGYATSTDHRWTRLQGSGLDWHAEVSGMGARASSYSEKIAFERHQHSSSYASYLAHRQLQATSTASVIGSHLVDLLTGEVTDLHPAPSTIFDITPDIHTPMNSPGMASTPTAAFALSPTWADF